MKTRKAIAALTIGALLGANAMDLALARNRDNTGRGNSHGNLADYSPGNGRSYITPIQMRQMRHAQMLSEQDQNTINNRINRVPLVERLDFLLTVLTRAETLRTNIEGSSRTPAQKTRLLGLLDEVVNIVQNRISSDIIDQADEADDHTGPTTSAFSISGVGSGSATLSITSNESWKGHFVVLQSGGTAPTLDQVKAGQNGSGQTAPISGSSPLVIGMNQFSLTGLSPNTNYTVYFVAEDTFENFQGMVTSGSFTTGSGTGTGTGTTGTGTGTTGTGTTGTGSTGTGTTGTGTTGTGITPPITTGFDITNIASNSARISFTANESGTGYFVVLQSGSTVPTPLQVKSWQNANGSAAVSHGSKAMTSGLNQIDISALIPDMAYVAYFIAEDTAGSLQSTLTTKTFATLPTGTGSTGTGSTGTGTTGTGSTGTGTTGTGTTGTGSTGTGTTGTGTTGTGTTGTGTDRTAPTITAEYLTGVTSSGAMLQLTSNESGTIYGVALMSGATPPSVAQVRAGQDATGSPATLSATFMATAGTNQFNMNGFSPATAYKLYFIAEDAAGNRESSPHTLTLITTP